VNGALKCDDNKMAENVVLSSAEFAIGPNEMERSGKIDWHHRRMERKSATCGIV